MRDMKVPAPFFSEKKKKRAFRVTSKDLLSDVAAALATLPLVPFRPYWHLGLSMRIYQLQLTRGARSDESCRRVCLTTPHFFFAFFWRDVCTQAVRWDRSQIQTLLRSSPDKNPSAMEANDPHGPKTQAQV